MTLRLAKLFPKTTANMAANLTMPPGEHRQVVANALRGGTVVFDMLGGTKNLVDPSAPPMSHAMRTDGKWLWPERMAEYVEKDGLMPEPELMEHLAAHRYVLPAPAPSVALQRHAWNVMIPNVPFQPAPQQDPGSLTG